MDGVYEDDTYKKLLGPGWGDDAQVAVDLNLSAGTGFWTQSEEGGKLIISGEVGENNVVVVPVNKMTLVANPLPMSVNLQDIHVDGYSEEGADWIKIYNPSTYTYTTVYYWGEAMDGVYEDDTYKNLLGPGWGDEAQVAVDLEILAGQGFWTQAEEGGSLVFPSVQ
jgi:hypothetical protein